MVRERSDTVLPEPAAVRLAESGGFEGATVGLDRIRLERPGPASGTVPLHLARFDIAGEGGRTPGLRRCSKPVVGWRAGPTPPCIRQGISKCR
jgi:hypothetical protein